MLMKDDPDKEDKFPFDDIIDFNKINPYKIFYDFYEDTWIGYLPSSEISSSKVSKSKNKERNTNDIKILISQAIEIFKTKGIEQIETDISINNDILKTTLQSNNFEYVDSERLVSRLPLNEIIISDTYNDVNFLTSKMKSMDLHSESSFLSSKGGSELEENVISFLTDKENISKESLRSFFDYLKKNPDKLISQTTLMNNESIQGYTMVVRTRWNPKIGILSFLDMVNTDSSSLMDLIVAQSIQDCKNNEIDLLEVHIRDDVLEKENSYLTYGFEFKNLHRFQLTK